jgi:GDP-L-fucose synthase
MFLDSTLESLRGARVFVAGARTALGSAIARTLHKLTGVEVCGLDTLETALRDPAAAERLLTRLMPTHVIVAGGRSGGIALNSAAPADLMVDNLRLATAILPAAHRCKVRALLYVASSCTYPRVTSQPMRPDALFSGPLEPTSEAYAMAKLAGIVLCQAYRDQYGADFVAAIAADAYGPDDTFDPENSHVVAGLIRRMHEARARGDAAFTVWGTGCQVRDLVYVDDLASACLIALARYHNRAPINLSSGAPTSIADLAMAVREVVGFGGDLVFDTSRPDGVPIKTLETTTIRLLGFTPRTALHEGLERTYRWFLEQGAPWHAAP